MYYLQTPQIDDSLSNLWLPYNDVNPEIHFDETTHVIFTSDDPDYEFVYTALVTVEGNDNGFKKQKKMNSSNFGNAVNSIFDDYACDSDIDPDVRVTYDVKAGKPKDIEYTIKCNWDLQEQQNFEHKHWVSIFLTW